MAHRHEPGKTSRVPKSLLTVWYGEHRHMPSESTATRVWLSRAKTNLLLYWYFGLGVSGAWVRKSTWFIRLRFSRAVGRATLSKAQLMAIWSCAGGSCPAYMATARFWSRMRRALPGLYRKGVSGFRRRLQGLEWMTPWKRRCTSLVHAKSSFNEHAHVTLVRVAAAAGTSLHCFSELWFYLFKLPVGTIQCQIYLVVWGTGKRLISAIMHLSPVIMVTELLANTTESIWRHYHCNKRNHRQRNSKWWPRKHGTNSTAVLQTGILRLSEVDCHCTTPHFNRIHLFGAVFLKNTYLTANQNVLFTKRTNHNILC